MAQYKHIMVDLETIGLRTTSVITSIAAIEFDITTGDTGNVFYNTINIQSCINKGLTVDGKSLEWWISQNNSKKKMFKETQDIETVLNKFHVFMSNYSDDVEIWGNGSKFDLGILENAYYGCYNVCKLPWKFNKERDVRTIVSLAPEIKKRCVFRGNRHDPRDDCRYQIKYLSDTYNHIMAN